MPSGSRNDRFSCGPRSLIARPLPAPRPRIAHNRAMTAGREVFIVEALRTPIGRYGGALAEVRPDDLAAAVIKALVERTRIDPAAIGDVILGCANQAGDD